LNPWETADLAVLETINREWTHPVLDTFFVWLTKPPHEEVYFIVAAILLMTLGGRRGRLAVPWVALAVLLADQISASVLKPWIDRMRPCFAHPEEVRLLLERQARSPSFPSSHATNAFAVAMVLFGVHKWLGWSALGLAFLIAYSRPYVGVHYPSDTLAGLVLGVLLGLGCLYLQRRFLAWRKGRQASAAAEVP